MKLAIVTDAWEPQVNGVVTTLKMTRETLVRQGHTVRVFEPSGFKSVPCPSYPEIRLALNPGGSLKKSLASYGPEAVHIATEGPMGLAARALCKNKRWAFTTSYHTQFPEYIRKRYPVPLWASYMFLRWFHSASACTMVGTAHLEKSMRLRGFENLARWPRGVDTRVFNPDKRASIPDPRPIWIYVGRVSVEKNIEAFLKLDLPGTKYVIGHGPACHALRKAYREVRFVGYKFGEELASHLAASDVFVFPSKTDTFGIVMLEAMACGTPVAAYPVTGPIDVVRNRVTGCLDKDLRQAALDALELDPEDCRNQALEHTWESATHMFLSNITPVSSGRHVQEKGRSRQAGGSS